jgi:hypothetical protein
MESDLGAKCEEDYNKYPVEEGGGPLLFAIMMEKLVSRAEAATKYLQELVKGFKITSLQGENVSNAVSLIRGAHQRLSSINELPNNFKEELLKAMQTTSTQEFNQVFLVLETQKKINDQLPEAYRQRELTIDQILSLAETTYLNQVFNK